MMFLPENKDPNRNSSNPNFKHLQDVISRLIEVVHDENQALETDRGRSLGPFIEKKGQLLLELLRAQKHIQPELIRSEVRTDILRLRHEMSINKQKLSIHFAAAKDIADALLDVLRHNESDGTYSGWSQTGRLKQ